MAGSFLTTGFPGSSASKESTRNAGDPGSIPASSGSPGEGIGYPLQYSWGSLVAQLVKNLPTMWETWVQSPGWEGPLEKGKATHSSSLTWRIPWTVWLSDFHFCFSTTGPPGRPQGLFSSPSPHDLAHATSSAHSAPPTGLSCWSASEHSGSPSSPGTPGEPSDPVYPFSQNSPELLFIFSFRVTCLSPLA